MNTLKAPLKAEGKFITDASGQTVAISAMHAEDFALCVNSHEALVAGLWKIVNADPFHQNPLSAIAMAALMEAGEKP